MPADRDEFADRLDGGDAACWAHLLCASCGRMLEATDRARLADDDEPLCQECSETSR